MSVDLSEPEVDDWSGLEGAHHGGLIHLAGAELLEQSDGFFR